MSVVRKWNPDALKKEILNQIEVNAPEAGQFIVDDARRRLIAIREPEWGRVYRQKIVANLLRVEVERKQNEVTIKVGVAKTSDSRHHGFYIELGSSTAPAHPFLRPAVFQNGATIIGLLTRQ